jgi:3-hydroxybutyryl-CoA dehydrogenase
MKGKIQRIAVIGCGYMGTQVAFHAAFYGFPVQVTDLDHRAYTRALSTMEEEYSRRRGLKPASSGEKEDVFNRIRWAPDLAEAVHGADLVIETIKEDLAAKRDIFKKMETLVPPETILTTGSSSLKASLIGEVLKNPERMLNVHFYRLFRGCNMADVMGGNKTSPAIIEAVKEWLRAMDCVPLLVKKEITGFLFNRIWRAVKKESLHLWAGGYADFEDIDRAWMIFTGMPMGPFGAMDLTGLDVVRDIEMIYCKESGDLSDEPPRALAQKIAEGELGIKTKKGFYTYPGPQYLNPDWLKGK